MNMWFSDIWIGLLDASLKASIVLILALAAVGLLRRAPARLRHPLIVVRGAGDHVDVRVDVFHGAASPG